MNCLLKFVCFYSLFTALYCFYSSYPLLRAYHAISSHPSIQDHYSINLRWTCHISPSLVSALAAGSGNIMCLTVHAKHTTTCLLHVK